jgi:rhodanese-related sulfurtransferase
MALLLVTTLALAACGVQQAAGDDGMDLRTQQVPVNGGGSYTDVSAGSLHTMLKDKDFPLINVHIPYEGEIEGTDLFIPFDEIEANVDRLPLDKGAKLVLYCRSGSMSATAARTLVGLGYSDVWNLDGGMIAWEEAGYPLLHRAK